MIIASVRVWAEQIRPEGFYAMQAPCVNPAVGGSGDLPALKTKTLGVLSTLGWLVRSQLIDNALAVV